jgi:glutamyl-tRNA synthetase
LEKKENTELRELIRKIALLNAIQHHGKAQEGPVIGKLLAERRELRAKVNEISDIVGEVVQDVNSLPLNKQRRIVEEKWPETLVKERVEEEKRLPPLPNVDRYAQVVTRFSPNPDCVLHLGSARAIILCYEYARLYKGRFFLRFEDTDPKLKRPVLGLYNSVREDLAWLGCKPDE